MYMYMQVVYRQIREVMYIVWLDDGNVYGIIVWLDDGNVYGITNWDVKYSSTDWMDDTMMWYSCKIHMLLWYSNAVFFGYENKT